jgi:hypothetical protein
MKGSIILNMSELRLYFLKNQKLMFVFLGILFLLISIVPPVGILLSSFILLFIFYVTFFNRIEGILILLFFLFIANTYDPHLINFIDFWKIMNPMHLGALEIINPNQIFGIATTCCLIFLILQKLIITSKIKLFNIFYLLLVFISLLTSFMGWQLDHERKLQSLMFMFNISFCIWFYRLVINLKNKELKFLIHSFEVIFSLLVILYLAKFLYSGIGTNTHIKFFLFALAFPGAIYCLKNISNFRMILFLMCFCIIIESFFQSLTTQIIVLSGLLFYFLSSLRSNFFIKCIFFGTIAAHIFIFLSPFFDITITKPENYLAYENVYGFINRVIFKFSLDRMPLWVAAIDAIRESYWLMPSGSTYIPYNIGTFSSVERQIQWTAGAHQFQLELMANYGIFGAGIFWGIWLTFMKKIIDAICSSQLIIRLLSIALLSYFLFPGFVANFMIQEFALFPWIIIGFVMALHDKQRNKISFL